MRFIFRRVRIIAVRDNRRSLLPPRPASRPRTIRVGYACVSTRFGIGRLAPGIALSIAYAATAHAQHADDNAITSAEDAFGTTVGHEVIGVYNDNSIRGFSAVTANNIRIEGMYFDIESNLNSRIMENETIHVGPSAQGYAFPAPTGIADYTLTASGEELAISPITSTDSFGSYSLETDARVPLIAHKLSTAIGFGLFNDRYGIGGGSKRWNIGMVPRWQVAEGVEVIAFYTREQTDGETALGTYVPTGEFLPNKVMRATYPGPFLGTDYYGQNFGAVLRANLGDWTLRGGIFRSFASKGNSYANLINVNPDMSTDRQIEGFPAGNNGSWSGEVRASRRFAEGPRKHLLTLSLRGRDISNHYGNGDTVDLGAAGLDQVIDPPPPVFTLGPLGQERTHQITLAASYSLNWSGLGELTLGAQRTKYIRAAAPPGFPYVHSGESLWLPSVSLAVPLGKSVSLYASYVRGLEDAGAAPYYATNAGELLPADHTSQYDGGLKWTITKETTLILGYFDVGKPYIDLNYANRFAVLGQETHRGVEASLTTTLMKDVTLVFGGIFAQPRVTAAPGAGQTIGKMPVGVNTSIQFNVNYQLPFAKALTLDASAIYSGRQAGTVDNIIMLRSFTTFGVGARYGFTVDDRKVTFRISINNLTNSFSWLPIGSGIYTYSNPRSINTYLTANL